MARRPGGYTRSSCMFCGDSGLIRKTVCLVSITFMEHCLSLVIERPCQLLTSVKGILAAAEPLTHSGDS